MKLLLARLVDDSLARDLAAAHRKAHDQEQARDRLAEELSCARKDLAAAQAEIITIRMELAESREQLEQSRAALRVAESENRLLWTVIERDRLRVQAEISRHARDIALSEAGAAELARD